jgi:hypothetical protein
MACSVFAERSAVDGFDARSIRRGGGDVRGGERELDFVAHNAIMVSSVEVGWNRHRLHLGRNCKHL